MILEPVRKKRSPEDDSFVGMRVGVLLIIVFALFGVLSFRLWFLQILSGDSYVAVAKDNRQRDVKVEARARGGLRPQRQDPGGEQGRSQRGHPSHGHVRPEERPREVPAGDLRPGPDPRHPRDRSHGGLRQGEEGPVRDVHRQGGRAREHRRGPHQGARPGIPGRPGGGILPAPVSLRGARHPCAGLRGRGLPERPRQRGVRHAAGRGDHRQGRSREEIRLLPEGHGRLEDRGGRRGRTSQAVPGGPRSDSGEQPGAHHRQRAAAGRRDRSRRGHPGGSRYGIHQCRWRGGRGDGPAHRRDPGLGLLSRLRSLSLGRGDDEDQVRRTERAPGSLSALRPGHRRPVSRGFHLQAVRRGRGSRRRPHQRGHDVRLHRQVLHQPADMEGLDYPRGTGTSACCRPSPSRATSTSTTWAICSISSRAPSCRTACANSASGSPPE